MFNVLYTLNRIVMIALILYKRKRSWSSIFEAIRKGCFGGPFLGPRNHGLEPATGPVRGMLGMHIKCTLRSIKIDPMGTTKKVQSTPGNGSTRVRRRRMQGDLIKLSAVAEDAELRS